MHQTFFSPQQTGRTVRRIIATLAVVAASAMQPAKAEDVPFSGSVASTCTMVVTRDGRLYLRNNGQRLRSNTSNGNARVNVFTNDSGFELSVDSPTSFDVEPTDDVASLETFRTEVRGRRDTVFGWTSGPAALNAGETRTRVRMIITKSGSDTFAAGNYSATATLRCE